MNTPCDGCGKIVPLFQYGNDWLCGHCATMEDNERDKAEKREKRISDEEWESKLAAHRRGWRPACFDVVIPQPEHWGKA